MDRLCRLRRASLQLRKQFHPEGSNLGASTCYHRLSSEMMLCGAALMLHLAASRPLAAARWWRRCPQVLPSLVAERHTAPSVVNSFGLRVPFDASDSVRLMGMGQFTADLLRGDGTIPQIGDDDSGRFLRLSFGSEPYADILSHAHLPPAANSLFTAGAGSRPATVESQWMRTWIGKGMLDSPVSDELRERSRFRAYHGFGLYLWNRNRFRLALRCGHVGQNGNGGHAHSDQLAITLDVNGLPVFTDAGSRLYTPNPRGGTSDL